MKALLRNLLPVHALLLLVGSLDLWSTVYWLETGKIIEFNPLMATVLKAGVHCFILVKLLSLGVYIVFMEWYRRRSESFARHVGSFTVAAYLSIYTSFFICINYTSLL